MKPGSEFTIVDDGLRDPGIPSWQLVAHLAAYASTLLADEETINAIRPTAEEFADVLLDVSFDEISTYIGVDLARRIYGAPSTMTIAVAIAAHALETGGIA